MLNNRSQPTSLTILMVKAQRRISSQKLFNMKHTNQSACQHQQLINRISLINPLSYLITSRSMYDLINKISKDFYLEIFELFVLGLLIGAVDVKKIRNIEEFMYVSAYTIKVASTGKPTLCEAILKKYLHDHKRIISS